MIEIALAFAAGLLTAAAPCILPLLPVLLGASIGQQDRRRPLFLVAGFILTFSGFAILFGSFSTVLGLSHDTLRKVSVILLGSFGVLLLWPQPYEWLMARSSGLLSFADGVVSRAGSGNAGGLVLGLALGVLWTPVRRAGARLHSHADRNIGKPGARRAAARHLRDRRRHPDPADRLWRTIRDHASAEACALHPGLAANIRCGSAARRARLLHAI